MKRKCAGWILRELCDFDLTRDDNLVFFKVKFQNNRISDIVALIDVKRKRRESGTGLTT